MGLAQKPNWKGAPEWAKYLACDRDGTWFWFSKKPSCAGWSQNVWYLRTTGSVVEATEPEIVEGWRKTLEKRPAKQTP